MNQFYRKIIRFYIIFITLNIFFSPYAIAGDSVNWGLKNSKSEEAWQITRGKKNVVVAIIDTGIDAEHNALKNNLWTNPLEIKNGIDDDGNGYIDDIHGWSFSSNSADLTDNHGHGTHIAGIVSGVAPNARLMIIKYYSPGSSSVDNLKNTVKAIEYAVKMNAQVINYSGGGQAPNVAEERAIRIAEAKGIVFVAAAGNEKSNADVDGFYPAAYNLSNIISVTALDKKAEILKTSNYGPNSIDIAAPGKDVYSTLPGNRYGHMTGTSQATAFVSGAAALVLSKYQTPPGYEHIVKAILSTNITEPQFINKTRSEAQLNIYRALAIEGSGVSAFGQITSTPNDSTSYINSD